MLAAIKLTIAGVRFARTLASFLGGTPAALEVLAVTREEMTAAPEDLLQITLGGPVARERLEALQEEIASITQAPFGLPFDATIN